MKKDFRVYLDDIIASSELISKYSKGITKQEFEESTDIQDAVTRRLEIIGEAVKRLPYEARQQHPEIAWKKATGMQIFNYALTAPQIKNLYNNSSAIYFGL